MPWLVRWAAMLLSRYGKGKDGKTPYERQRGRKCELDLVPFGEIVLYRLPEVATDRHQALEPRWDKGVWLGYARHSSEVLIGTPKGIIKAWSIRRQPEGQQEDGELVKALRGSPTNWKIDASEDSQLVELGDRNDPALNPDLGLQVGRRTGEKRSMYLSRRDFEKHGYTDGCRGCLDLASGKPRAGSFLSPQCGVPTPDGSYDEG